MSEIEIYCTRSCPFCIMAKQLLDKKGLSYQSKFIEGRPDLKEEMILRSNQKSTVPQIFANGVHIGDCDRLYELEASGQLDEVLTKGC